VSVLPASRRAATAFFFIFRLTGRPCHHATLRTSYPAGFLWAYTGLYYLTNHGRSILSAQIIFATIYLATLAVVFTIYSRCRSVRAGAPFTARRFANDPR